MSDGRLPSNDIILHIWPAQWGIPSFDPHSLAVLMYLQLTMPGKFRVVETSNPDASPTGQLPYLVHEQYSVSSFPSIIKYLSELRAADYTEYPNANLDLHLSPTQRAQNVAWCTHAESHLGDLVSHALYSSFDNWTKMTALAMASTLPVPQRYYVPRRIRNLHLHKLQAVDLWSSVLEEEKPKKPFVLDIKVKQEASKESNKIMLGLERNRMLGKFRSELDVYNQLLEGKAFLFGDRPSTADLVITSRLILLLRPPFPDSSFTEILKSYPALSQYAEEIYALAFHAGSPLRPISSSTYFSVRAFFPPFRTSPPDSSQDTLDAADVRFNRMSWGFLGLAVGSAVAYWAILATQSAVNLRSPSESDVDDSEL